MIIGKKDRAEFAFLKSLVDEYKDVIVASKKRDIESMRYIKSLEESVDSLSEKGLRLPKSNLIIYSNHGKNEGFPTQEKEKVAENGRWKRVPMDGEPLIVFYK